MAQIENYPLLTLCIPIYNRRKYLERQLERFREDKELFDRKIQLIISDNCSEEDLGTCCKKYQAQGLLINYHRQETNIGPDKNFEWGFHHADGKYVWLLGSDDVPVTGVLRKLVEYLEGGEYGLVHLSMRKKNRELTVFEMSDDMAVAVNFWITYLSANIIKTESLKTVDLSDYRKSFMIQVPAYLNACCSFPKNALIYLPQFFEKETDNANNGGYNLFQVFVTNLYGIYESFVEKNLLSRETFDRMIEAEYKEFLSRNIINLLILHRNKNFDIDGAWDKLKKYYGCKAYAYYYPIFVFFKLIAWRVILLLRLIKKVFHGRL